MKATAKFLVGCWVFCLATGQALASPHPVIQGWRAGCSVLAQTGVGDPTTRRKQSDGLLQQGRLAIRRGDLQAANRFITQAEQLGAQYDPLTERFTYTPAKARQELLELRQQLQASGAAPVGQSSIAVLSYADGSVLRRFVESGQDQRSFDHPGFPRPL